MSLQNVAGILEPSWPPWPQYTAFDYNYSVTNRGKMVNGKWTSQRNKSHTPPLFLDRLDQYLGPECPPTNSTNTSQKACDDDVRLFPDDIKRIEEKVMRFNIPHKIVLLVKEDIPYISLQFSRWHLRDTLNHTTGTRKMCPNCHIRNARKFIPPNPREPAHVRYFPSCSDYRNAKAFQDEGGGRDFPGQVLVGDCGESQHGSGRVFWDKGLEKMDYDSTFVDRGGPFVRTYAHLHLAPGHTYQQSGLPAFHTVSDFAEHLLTTPVPSWPRHVNNTHLLQRLGNTSILKDLHEKYDAAFLHGDCGHLRGMLLREMVEGSNESRVATIARYGRCFHNIETDDVMGGGYRRDNITKPKKDEEESEESKEVRMADMIHKDQEAHRDASKVALMSHHKFGFALENTLSPYYFTEKRWQVLIADSVPIVWNNDNSIQYLPDPDAALLVTVPSQKNAEEVAQVAQEVAKELHYYAQPEHEQEYLEKFFAWKHRGLRPDFVRKLFLSTDFLFCRICEYMAHHHFYDEET
ncbi:Alpha (1,3) fucosyltransferase [Seminavis robusta]|uniref:Fucosyltransferase n=1 Tax=Seminavis robusta TaxID=568900 RepID=A0A9N8HG33_9STRA|nr:Alpha (1,3) fucosyltransferase [Seminavis robusta]|eukprot:Sro609_g174920.1 (Alpha (1,3) fucosyltransferase (521) ;mRNA; f:4687-6249